MIEAAEDTEPLTLLRALLRRVLAECQEPGYDLTMQEAQKLAYFLRVAGQPLKLNHVAHYYNPEARIDGVQGWPLHGERKKQLFRPEHILIAWTHLRERGLLAPPTGGAL